MQEIKINLNDFHKVKQFVNICQSKTYNITGYSGRYIIDCKSILGIFSLDLTQPIVIKLETDENIDEFKQFEI